MTTESIPTNLRPRRTGLAGLVPQWNALSTVALSFLVLLVLAATLADVVMPGAGAVTVADRQLPPLSTSDATGVFHLLGTDSLGRDLVYQLLVGARVTLLVGLLSIVVAGTVGIALGLIAGYHPRGVGQVIMRVVDAQLTLPDVLIALLVLFVFGPSIVNLILVVALCRWQAYTRLTRALVLSMQDEAFVNAAKILGVRLWRILAVHILPNLRRPLLVLATMEFARVMLIESSLSFLGLGVQPPAVSWGLMLASGRNYIVSAWWLVTFPGIAILLTAVGFNYIAQTVGKDGRRTRRSRTSRKKAA